MDSYLPMPFGAHYDSHSHHYYPTQHQSHGYPHQQQLPAVTHPNPHNLPAIEPPFRRYHPYGHQDHYQHYRTPAESMMRSVPSQSEQDRAHLDRLLSGLAYADPVPPHPRAGNSDNYRQSVAHTTSGRSHERVSTQVRNMLGWPENHQHPYQDAYPQAQPQQHYADLSVSSMSFPAFTLGQPVIQHQQHLTEGSFYENHRDQAYVEQCRNEWNASWMHPAQQGHKQLPAAGNGEFYPSHSDAHYSKLSGNQTWDAQYNHLDLDVRGPSLDSTSTRYYQQDLQAPIDWSSQADQPLQMLPAPIPSQNAEPNTYLDYEDHPSFKKPPHRSSSLPKGQQKEKKAEVKRDLFDGVELIAEGAALIPPPPPIEKSAYPLSALATDLVWRSFLDASNIKGANQGLAASPMAYTASSGGSRSKDISPFSSQTSSSRSSASPQTRMSDKSHASGLEVPTHSFGAIGRERKPKSSNLSPGSESSSPASSSPGTPNQVAEGPVDFIRTSESHQHLAKFGIGIVDEDASLGLGVTAAKHGLPHMQPLPRSSSLQHRLYDNAYPAPPAALYDQIRRLISSTLISPQVLLLSLYYIKNLPRTSPLFPPATSQSALQSTSVPFKLLLAAMVVANKHLDDNSFRNFTFAQVSRVTLPEVNALEYSMLAGLNFNINVESDDWLAWLQEIQYMRATRFVDGESNIQSILSPIIQGVYAQRYEQNLAHEEQRHPFTLSGAPVLREEAATKPKARIPSFEIPLNPFTPRSARTESSWTDGSDLDAAVPLEHRPHYAPLNLRDTAPAIDPRSAFDDILPYYTEPVDRYSSFVLAA